MLEALQLEAEMVIDRNADAEGTYGAVSRRIPSMRYVETMCRTQRSSSAATTRQRTDRPQWIQSSQTEVWVKKWVDYSSLYGIAYHLSNGVTGVFFNDSSKLIYNASAYSDK